ncbi:HD-GYP domain-containing protein [Oleidesulfovibrio alaskensis]|uniref:HD-GYP domain-containing protein n=1 Tax=Oleidesulfovibrio alaskensis TaxID=58180 RepID=UPI000425440F|nr:HD domain-containing phosphohydrolase [Oleidesulfovibrio alaskensis]
MAETASDRTRELSRGSGRTGAGSKLLWFGIVAALFTVATAATLVLVSIRNLNADLEESVRKQQSIMLNGQVNVVTTWLDAMVEQGNRLINADLFRLYASEVDTLDDDLSALLSGENTELAVQLPMMRNLLREFVQYSDFVSGRIMNRQGSSYIATDASVRPLTPVQRQYADRTQQTGLPVFSNIRLSSAGLVVDLFLPIYPPRYESKEPTPVAVLMLTKNVSAKLGDILQGGHGRGQSMKLLQRSGERAEEVAPWLAEGVRTSAGLSLGDDALPFGSRTSVSGSGEVYSMGLRVPGLDWWLVQEADIDVAREPLQQRARAVVGFGVLSTLVILCMLGGFWWWLVGVESRKVAREMSKLAGQVEEQKRFLDSINATIADFICLKDDKGVIRYANRAFAEAVGRSEKELDGLDFAAVFGFDTARRLTATDEQVLMSNEPQTISETIYLQSRKYYFQISKTPFRIARRDWSGLVYVFRDITELAEAQERSRKLVQQTVDALVRTIEHSDPYLAGHSRTMSGLSAQVAKAMGLSALEVATVQAAANLSQVGKVFVPKEILNKPGALDEREKKEMERHVEHARMVLADIEFDLPVLQVIEQMNEKLDGSGYPVGISGDAISSPARILAVINTFCAMVRPRAYRPAVPVDDTLDALERMQDKYDAEVIARLREVVESATGEKLLQGLENAGRA